MQGGWPMMDAGFCGDVQAVSASLPLNIIPALTKIYQLHLSYSSPSYLCSFLSLLHFLPCLSLKLRSHIFLLHIFVIFFLFPIFYPALPCTVALFFLSLSFKLFSCPSSQFAIFLAFYICVASFLFLFLYSVFLCCSSSLPSSFLFLVFLSFFHPVLLCSLSSFPTLYLCRFLYISVDFFLFPVNSTSSSCTLFIFFVLSFLFLI